VIANQQGWACNNGLATHFQFNFPNAQELHGPSLHSRFTLQQIQLRKSKIDREPSRQYMPNAAQQLKSYAHV
jgi:hypothetical protein